VTTINAETAEIAASRASFPGVLCELCVERRDSQ
jgi:hypothetical protein